MEGRTVVRRVFGRIGEVLLIAMFELGGPIVWVASMLVMLTVGLVALVRRALARPWRSGSSGMPQQTDP